MDDIVFVPAACLALLIVAIHVVRCLRAKRAPNVAFIVNAVLNAAGVVTGVLLVASTFDVGLRARLSNINIYVFISGLAVIFVCGQAVLRELFAPSTPE